MNRSRIGALASVLALVASVGSATFAGPTVAGDPGLQMAWPTTGRITQPYGCTGYPAEPRLGSCRHFHGGIDIADSRGTPIRAAAAGVVTFVGWDPWGTHAWMVFINHGRGVTTWYAHMRGKQIAGIHKGVRVRQGQVIGYMDSTGHSTGVHLHWSVVKDGRYANPRNYVSGAPYRSHKGGSPESAASCGDVWIASVPGAATAVANAADDGGGGGDTSCAA